MSLLAEVVPRTSVKVKSDGDSSNQSLKQSGEISWEDQIQNIWLNLLEPNISKYGRRFLKNDEECGINMVLQVIHAKFKAMQRHSSKQQEENDFYKKELESLKQQLELKSKEQVITVCNECFKKDELFVYERERYNALESKLKKCASLMNTMVTSDGDIDTFTSKGTLLASSAPPDGLASTSKSTPKPRKDLKLRRRLTDKQDDLTTSLGEVIVPATPDRAESSAESPVNATVVCVPETAPWPEVGVFHLPSSTPLKAPLAASEKRLKPSAASLNVMAHHLNSSDCFSPPIFDTGLQNKQDNNHCREPDDSDDDFQSFSRKKNVFERHESRFGNKSKAKSRNRSQTSEIHVMETDSMDERISGEAHSAGPASIDAASIPARSVPPNVENSPLRESKRRRYKGPEDWPCEECRRLFYEAGIDTRKLIPSMNFCPQHVNRMSYYLNTPPGFWNPTISGSPRKGRPPANRQPDRGPPPL